MDWLTQNWVWVALAIGAGLYFFRGGLGGHAGAHGGAHGGVLGGMAEGGHAGEGGHGGHGGQPDTRVAESAPEAAAGHPVRPVEAASERPRRRHGC